MKLTEAFQPTLKEVPTEATITSHRLMLRAGLVRQTAAGIYAWLPAGLRVLRAISTIVREEQDRIGAQEVLMPTLQSADLWRRSGRYDAYGPEMLRITDRHERELLYGPTNEEMITDIFGAVVKSYKELPLTLYHLQWKFRDEVRPRFGVMRGREFYMKDGYSFDVSKEGAERNYWRQMLAYLRTFRRIGVNAVPMQADTGPIGGNLSHEFLVLAPAGESGVFYDAAWEGIDWSKRDLDADSAEDLKAVQDVLATHYAATDEKHDEAAWEKVPAEQRREGRGIEVGQIFHLGPKYTEAMGVTVTGEDGSPTHPDMGCYGIGVSRLVGAIIEASHDDNGIIWPESVAPWRFALINLRPGDEATDALCARLYSADPENILYDDRKERAGVKFNDADLLGLPWQVIIGPRGAKAGQVELKNRASGERSEMPVDDFMARFGLKAS
ncbi:proline--tRNA ligase [Formicincola oecophyllae]|uniref:Proline--tRNA ligase n=1 Tax=Formicincola oecophyllae TaxID=2558361 RepID=A0A4Y6U7G7_9PROT|nr:proline--tRNA ligase [Formicincola oecophyllae]QDH12960.1 proline--tRNA ligase [Formicincola oecophyllae]